MLLFQFESEVQQFEFFISGNMDILAKNPSKDDIIQQALLQPNASEVYIQASAKIYSDRKKSWFNWRYKSYYIISLNFSLIELLWYV